MSWKLGLVLAFIGVLVFMADDLWAADATVVELQNDYVVAACDLGGCRELYRGPDPAQAGIAAAEYRAANPDKYPPLIRHDYFARVE